MFLKYVTAYVYWSAKQGPGVSLGDTWVKVIKTLFALAPLEPSASFQRAALQ